jgi:thiamine-phosphate pyrophosphorylase
LKDRAERRELLGRARLMLLFTPELCPRERDPLEILAALVPWVDAIQVRVKEAGLGLGPARPSYDWTKRVLALVEERRPDVLVLVNDRVDVAAALAGAGVDGVHLGADDAPGELAREVLGAEPLIGLSTHTVADVAASATLPIDYLGFGPLHPTATKGNSRGLGAEAAWIAAQATALPLFPIGGIDATNAGELAEIGRAAVSRALLAAPDPGQAARALRELLEQTD